MHRQLDGWLGEEAARNTKDKGRANLAVIQRGTPDVTLLDQAKGSLTTKLKPPCWSDELILKLLVQMRQSPHVHVVQCQLSALAWLLLMGSLRPVPSRGEGVRIDLSCGSV